MNDKVLPVVEEFYSVQGEGFHTGKPAYFIRLGGCEVGCSWCDTRYSWNAELHPLKKISELVENTLDSGTDSVVVTGGEPLMWNLELLCIELKKHEIMTFLETSGAYPLSGIWDWICLSPKVQNPPVQEIYNFTDELKIIVQEKSDFEWAEKNRSLVNKECHCYLQPEWSHYREIIAEIVEYVKSRGGWKISLQTHKFMQIP
jgi:7-carboxy-7-deazaguanine synthase